MKTLSIISSVLLVFPVFAQNHISRQLTDELTLLEAAKAANQIGKIASGVGHPEPGCREVVKTLNRSVSDNTDPNVKVIICQPEEGALSSPTGEDYSSIIRDNNIEFVTNDTYPTEQSIINTREFRLFIHELKKFPRPLLQEMASVGGKIRVMIGDGVTQDPTWDAAKLKAMQMTQDQWDYYNKYGGTVPAQTVEQVRLSFENTSEGARKWDLVSGSGGVFTDPNAINPTRIVINRMYKALHRLPDGEIVEWDQGATNLVLHEHGHALDNLYGHHAVSSSPKWKEVMKDPAVKSYVAKIFDPTYEGRFEEEGFAEAFSYYHACPQSRQQMEQNAPKLADFFRDFTTVRDLRPDLYQSWKKRYGK